MASPSSATLILSTIRADARPPLVTVAVSTYQRPHLLPRLLDALTRQTLPREDFEVVVVDNGSAPDTAEAIKQLGMRSGLQLHALRIEPNRGPARARNTAWRHARAEVVAFTDDDCQPTATWLERGLEAMSLGNAVVGGQTLPDPDVPIGPFSRTMRVRDVTWLPTCNAFYYRRDLEAVDGFDESFVSPLGEDTDLAYRVRSLCGREFRYAEDALVFHDVRSSRFLDAAKEAFERTGAVRFFKLHPEARHHLHRRLFWKPTHSKVLLAAAGLALGSRWPEWLLLVWPWLNYRTRVTKFPGGRRAYPSLPGVFVVDLLETLGTVRGSIKHRTFVV